MASSTASTATPIRHAFERRADDVKPLKSDINSLVLDYLTTEGYSTAAANFSKEANLLPIQDEQSIKARRDIQDYIHSGHIQEAIDALNELESQVLDKDPSLHFALLRLQLVELIRICNATPGGNIQPALKFATTELAPRAPLDKEFMEDLERTMALLVFPKDALEPHLADLLKPRLRQDVADKVNKAILANQVQRRDATIRSLVRLRAWTEDTARASKKNLPAHLELEGLDGTFKEQSHENGHEPMIS